MSETSNTLPRSPHAAPPPDDYDAIDLRELWSRLMHGLPQTLGLAVLGLAAAALTYAVLSPLLPTETTSRVVFSFPGYARSEYPDHSKFQADDLRAPDIVSEALKRQGLDTTEAVQAKVRAALSIEGIIPPNIVKERDRLRASGQTPAPYIPDEYAVTLSLPRKFPLSSRQREMLLNEIVSVYRDKFQRTYANVPLAFGNAFATLQNADFFEYELILSQEMQNILTYLEQQMEKAKTFRSPTTNLSYSDLLKQAQLFNQIRLNETLGLIRQHGLSKNRTTAMVKMDYYLRLLEDQERKAVEEEKVVQELLTKTQERGQGYVLGVKSAQSQPNAPIIDQGLIDSLLANDAYNFLVREALRVGRKVKEIQAEKAVLLERRNSMEAFLQGEARDQTAVITEVTASLKQLESDYKALVDKVRLTHEDFSRQEFADAIRTSMQAGTAGFYRTLVKMGIVGLGIGLAAGAGLSLLGVFGGQRKAQT
ncbi:MAG: hypothetical protein ACOZE5_03995 [Verrucomicrobiota bacterium]